MHKTNTPKFTQKMFADRWLSKPRKTRVFPQSSETLLRFTSWWNGGTSCPGSPTSASDDHSTNRLDPGMLLWQTNAPATWSPTLLLPRAAACGSYAILVAAHFYLWRVFATANSSSYDCPLSPAFCCWWFLSQCVFVHPRVSVCVGSGMFYRFVVVDLLDIFLSFSLSLSHTLSHGQTEHLHTSV